MGSSDAAGSVAGACHAPRLDDHLAAAKAPACHAQQHEEEHEDQQEQQHEEQHDERGSLHAPSLHVWDSSQHRDAPTTLQALVDSVSSVVERCQA